MASLASSWSTRNARQATVASRSVSRPFGSSLRPPFRANTLPVVRVANVTQDSFEAEVLQASSTQPVLVDFWANWCGPCKLVAPMMDWAEKEFAAQNLKVVKVEHDKNPKLIAEFKVYGLPALAMFKDGKLIEGSKREGAITRVQLGEYIKKNLA